MLGAGLAGAETIVPGGIVSGTWSVTGSPYLVQGNITVPDSQALDISPGVEVIFQGHYSLTIHGHLESLGTASDSVIFTAADTVMGWGGLRFDEADSGCHLGFCRLEYAINTWPLPGGNGGAIFLDDTDSLIVVSCTIIRNKAAVGGGMYLEDATAEISNTTLQFNQSETDGGGIAVFVSAVNMYQCNLKNNIASQGGGGIRGQSCGDMSIIRFCSFEENQASGGGGVSGQGFNVTLEYCQVTNNSATYQGAGVGFDQAAGILRNCTVSQNNSPYGAGIHLTNGAPQVHNTIVEGNSPGAGIYMEGAIISPSVTYCDLSGNAGGAFGGYIPSGYGQLEYLNANGDSCDMNHNIFLDPRFVNAAAGDFHLLEDSPCIDAGDPASPPDSDWTVRDMGRYYFDQSQLVDLGLLPHNPPIIIPAPGGSFQFDLQIANHDASSHTVDVATLITAPYGLPYPALSRSNITLPPGAILIRANLTQWVPGSATPGVYEYIATLRDHTTWQLYDQSSFPFTKQFGDGPEAHGRGWDLLGWEEESTTALPHYFALHPAYPNPFNPTTAVSFELRAASRVNLKVYDTAGREVKTLVEGWREAGVHQVTFDGSGLASGVYLVRMEAGDFTATMKLVLLK